MKKVAPELESLMWTLAEDGNDRAIDEFGNRHPEMRTELLHRIQMVKGLRGAKKRTVEAPKAIPRFIPKETKPSGPRYLVAGLVLAALGALTFAVTMMVTPAPRGHKEDPLPTQPSFVAPRQTVQTPLPQVDAVPKVEPPTPAQTAADQGLKPGTLKIEHAPLMTVIQMISAVCGVTIEPAPGMPNPDVVVDYRNMNAMQMLRDLGKQYNFTPLDQHDGSILVVPAVDRSGKDPEGTFQSETRDRKIGG